MIQNDDNEVLRRNLEQYTRICKEIQEHADLSVKSVFSMAIMGKKLYVVIITYYTVDRDTDLEFEDKGYVTVDIPKQFQFNKQVRKFSADNYIRLIDTIYIQLLKRIQEKYPVEEHDLHTVLIERVSVLDPWHRYEAHL